MKKVLLIVVLAVLIGALLPARDAHAATFTANDAASLTAAINDANTNGEPDTITLTSNITLTAVDNTDDGPSGLPSITSEITIAGGGFTVARDGGAPNFRLLRVASGGDLTLLNVTLSNGNVTGSGGGILNEGALTVTNSTISGNSVTNDGGGIANFGALTVINSTLSANSAGDNAGGIINRGGTATVTNSTLSANSANGSGGGGIANEGALTVTNSTLSANSATNGFGGGIANVGTLTVINSTLSANSATDDFGGGGIANFGALTVTNSTISGNSATNGGGGGIYADTFSFGALTVTNSIIADNSATNGGDNCDGSITDDGGNFSQAIAGDGCPASFGDIIPGTDYNTTLADNGGLTQTHALLAGSPAIDQNAPTANDQRGVPVQGASRDSGAYEFGADSTYPTVGFASAGQTYNESDGTVSIPLTITGAQNFDGTVSFYVADIGTGTATAGTDYAAFPTTEISIDCSASDCANGTASVSLTLNTDAILEPDETVNLSIVGTNGFADVGQADFTATITDTTTATVTATDAQATENPTDNGQFTVDLGAVNQTGGPITVSYDVSGTATPGDDYTALSGSVDIPVGQQTATIDVVPVDDALTEGDETVTLTLTGTNNPAATVDTTAATVTIIDNEQPVDEGTDDPPQVAAAQPTLSPVVEQVTELPTTGQTPPWRGPLLALIVGVSLAATGALNRVLR